MTDIDDSWEQIEKDFEDYLDKMAAGAYPEAEAVEQDVRKMKEVNPNAPEENLRKLAVSYIAAKKRIRQWRRDTVTEDLAEPMMPKLFSGDLECVDSLPPIQLSTKMKKKPSEGCMSLSSTRRP